MDFIYFIHLILEKGGIVDPGTILIEVMGGVVSQVYAKEPINVYLVDHDSNYGLVTAVVAVDSWDEIPEHVLSKLNNEFGLIK